MAATTYDHSMLAGIYDELVQQLGWTRVGPNGEPPEDVRFYLAELGRRGLPPPQSMLELGAGTGRVALALAQAGYETTGLDAAEQMLRVAESKRADLPADAQTRVRFVHGSWHDTDLGAGAFDVVLCPFSSFQTNVTLEEQDSALRLAHHHLRPNGLVVLDMFFPDLSLLAMAERTRSARRRVHWKGKRYREYESVLRLMSAQKLATTLEYEPEDGPGESVRQTIELTWFLPPELRRMLAANGFDRIEILDGYRGGPVRDDSRRQIVLGSRAEQ